MRSHTRRQFASHITFEGAALFLKTESLPSFLNLPCEVRNLKRISSNNAALQVLYPSSEIDVLAQPFMLLRKGSSILAKAKVSVQPAYFADGLAYTGAKKGTTPFAREAEASCLLVAQSVHSGAVTNALRLSGVLSQRGGESGRGVESFKSRQVVGRADRRPPPLSQDCQGTERIPNESLPEQHPMTRVNRARVSHPPLGRRRTKWDWRSQQTNFAVALRRPVRSCKR